MDKRTIISSIALLTGSAFLYLYRLHNSLSHQVTHSTHSGPLSEWPTGKDASTSTSDTPPLPIHLDTILPKDVLHNLSAYTGIYDQASLLIPTSSLPSLLSATHDNHPSTPPSSNTPQLLIAYLRYTMVNFSRFPQYHIMKLMYRSEPSTTTRTFDVAHIAQLDFIVDDIVNGGYRVVQRTPTQAVFAMVLPQNGAREPAPQTVHGRLIVGMHGEEGTGQTVFYSCTLQWKRRSDEGTVVLPLERTPVRWLHELASWWLLVRGTRYLVSS